MPVIQIVEIGEELHVVAKLLLHREIPPPIGSRKGIRNRRLTDARHLVRLREVRCPNRESLVIVADGHVGNVRRLIGHSVRPDGI